MTTIIGLDGLTINPQSPNKWSNTMKSTHNKYLVIVIVLLGISNICFGQNATSNIVLGQTISIESKTLNETREIFVYTPEGQ